MPYKKPKEKTIESSDEVEEEIELTNKEPEELEEQIEETEQEQEIEDFADFIPMTSTGERTAPTLQASEEFQEIPDTNIEEIAETNQTTEENEQPIYVVNAPDYAGSGDYADTRQQEPRTTDMQRDATRGELMLRKQELASPHTRNINLQTFQERELGEIRTQEEKQEDYVTRLKRKKDEDKLPFQ